MTPVHHQNLTYPALNSNHEYGSLGERVVFCLKRVLSIPLEFLKQCFECIKTYFQSKSLGHGNIKTSTLSPSIDLQVTPSPALVLKEFKSTDSGLVDFFVSRFITEEDPVFYQKVSQLFACTLPDIDMVEHFKNDPITDKFECHLKRAHQKGNEWITTSFEPVIRGRFETMKDGKTLRVIVDEGISSSSFGYTREAKLLYLNGDRLHTTINPGILFMKNFSMNVEEAIKWTVGFKTLPQTT